MKGEHYIPFDKAFLLEQMIDGSLIPPDQQGSYKKLFEILEHYFHYETFLLNRKLKINYAAYDPDRENSDGSSSSLVSDLNIFKETLTEVLERGNYNKVEEATLMSAFKVSDLVGLRLQIDFNDFQEYFLFTRRLRKTTEEVPHLHFWKKDVEVEFYERVMLYLHYQERDFFESRKKPDEKLSFEPGSIVLKIFKRVPKNDLETIFPNAVPRMSTLDKLLLWIPGVGGGLPILTAKVLPALIALYSAYKSGESLTKGHGYTALFQGLAALGILGAYLFRQYNGYITKKIKFAKMLSDSLYFKNLGNNSGVFHSLLDASEEEELKEAILAYAFLHKAGTPLSAGELDKRIEHWFIDRFQTDLDFDVEDGLEKLLRIGLGSQSNGQWTVLPIEGALRRVDEIWDGLFDYNK